MYMISYDKVLQYVSLFVYHQLVLFIGKKLVPDDGID